MAEKERTNSLIYTTGGEGCACNDALPEWKHKSLMTFMKVPPLHTVALRPGFPNMNFGGHIQATALIQH